MTLSPPVRVFALVGVLALAGIGAFLLLLGRNGTGETSTPAPIHVAQAHANAVPVQKTSHVPAKHVRRTTPVELVPGLPGPVAHALRYRRIVVVTVYVPGASVDAFVRQEARAAAKTTHAGYVGIGATSENALTKLVAKTGVLPDPAVVVFRRPGVVATKLGVADRETIAQAVALARQQR
jgi:hypothetical protein